MSSRSEAVEKHNPAAVGGGFSVAPYHVRSYHWFNTESVFFATYQSYTCCFVLEYGLPWVGRRAGSRIESFILSRWSKRSHLTSIRFFSVTDMRPQRRFSLRLVWQKQHTKNYH